MSFYESDVAVVLLILFGVNSFFKGKIELQFEVGKQGINTIIGGEPSTKKGVLLMGGKARSIGLFATLFGIAVHIFFKGGDILFTIRFSN
ncbi:hypothetical protein [Pseudoalteromonas rhizosphaerae]|uniref:hypothetical protein n=1 Tax=Pseudoalteromonas rhizosphaerae TaxID=2518973 RepID=UPI001230C8EE|nr:hypothetical protein [Pseudoalteromonas rhizosphaerae]